MNTEFTCAKETLDFLLFSYFGITLDDANNPDKLINIAINKAHKDATMQGAYNALFKNVKVKNASEAAQSECTVHLKKALEKLSNMDTQAFNKWHESICQELVNVYATKLECAPEDKFSYGNAQKWVNMTIKYLYLMCGVFSGYQSGINEFMQNIGDTIMGIAPHLHVPVDSYIIEAVWETSVELPLKENKKRAGKYSSEKTKPWSKWNKPTYDIFCKTLQENVLRRDGRSPLVWENESWINVAKKRKKHAKKTYGNQN